MKEHAATDATDHRLITATQGGLPLCPEPYEEVARDVGLSTQGVMTRLEAMLADARVLGAEGQAGVR